MCGAVRNLAGLFSIESNSAFALNLLCYADWLANFAPLLIIRTDKIETWLNKVTYLLTYLLSLVACELSRA